MHAHSYPQSILLFEVLSTLYSHSQYDAFREELLDLFAPGEIEVVRIILNTLLQCIIIHSSLVACI